MNIQAILKKKKWSGKETGQVLIANFVDSVRKKADPSAPPLLTQKEYDRRRSAIYLWDDEKDLRIYEHVYNSLRRLFDRLNTNVQQFLAGCMEYRYYILTARESEILTGYAANIPYMTTQKHYNELIRDTQEMLLGTPLCFYDVFFDALRYLLDHTNTAPEAFKKELDKLKAEAVTNPRIIEEYNIEHKNGYYLLCSTGTRSDCVNNAEWKKIFIKEYLRTHKHVDENGKPCGYKETTEYYTQENQFRFNHFYYKGINEELEQLYKAYTGEELRDDKEMQSAFKILIRYFITSFRNEPINKMYCNLSPDHPYYTMLYDMVDGATAGNGEHFIEWYTSQEAPAELTKYNVILQLTAENHTYNATHRTAAENLKEFKADYPGIYKIVLKYIKDNVPQAAELKPTQYYKPFTTLGELAAVDFCSYKSRTEPTYKDISTYFYRQDPEHNFFDSQRMRNGIFVTAGQELTKRKNIDNMDKLLERINYDVTLDNIELNFWDDEINHIITNQMCPAMSYIAAYNAFIDIIQDVFDVGDIQALKYDTEDIYERLRNVNNMLHDTDFALFGTMKERAHKKVILEGAFIEFDYDYFIPDATAINKVKKEIQSIAESDTEYHALRSMYQYVDHLTKEGGA